jgi:hypothetical protein
MKSRSILAQRPFSVKSSSASMIGPIESTSECGVFRMADMTRFLPRLSTGMLSFATIKPRYGFVLTASVDFRKSSMLIGGLEDKAAM